MGPVCSPPCQNGGTCIDNDVCMCPAGFTGDQCDTGECGQFCICDDMALFPLAYCNPLCPYGGSCNIDSLTCDCSAVTIGQ